MPTIPASDRRVTANHNGGPEDDTPEPTTEEQRRWAAYALRAVGLIAYWFRNTDPDVRLAIKTLKAKRQGDGPLVIRRLAINFLRSRMAHHGANADAMRKWIDDWFALERTTPAEDHMRFTEWLHRNDLFGDDIDLLFDGFDKLLATDPKRIYRAMREELLVDREIDSLDKRDALARRDAERREAEALLDIRDAVNRLDDNAAIAARTGLPIQRVAAIAVRISEEEREKRRRADEAFTRRRAEAEQRVAAGLAKAEKERADWDARIAASIKKRKAEEAARKAARSTT